MTPLSRTLCALLSLSFIALAQPPRRTPQPGEEDLAFRFMGPAVGNRVASVAGVPGDPKIVYAGAASGGVWKSTDGGGRFTPVFDKQPVQAIGALAVSPTNPSTVWAGTGEAWVIRDSDLMGDGIYKSTDAGATWQNVGLKETGRIGRIIVHPKNPDIVYACAVGRATGPQQERGVFRTKDGGKTWDRVLFVDPDTGCSGLTLDQNDPDTLFAGMWQVVIHSWAMFSGGPSSGVYVTHDGGTNWTHIEGHGLPKSPLGKIDVATAPSNGKRVYALIQTPDQGSVWRSDDGGATWTSQSWQRELIGRAGYYLRLAVSPANPDEVLIANSSFWLSTDGGKSFRSQRWGGDTHDIWFDPKDANRFIITDDGGMYMTADHGKNGTRITLPIGQMYHVAVDDDVPYKIYSNMQDNTTMRGPSNAQESGPNVPGQGGGAGGGFGRRQTVEWEHGLGGCESGFTLPDVTDTNIIWATCYGNEVTRYDARTKLARSVSPWLHTLDSEPNIAKYRCHWSPPLAIDPFDHNTVYYGCQVVFKTTNGGNTWNVISEDLSTRDPKIIVSSGGIVGDNLGQFYGAVVFAIAPSEAQKGLVWVGTNDGKVWYTRDGGAKWNDVTANLKGLPAMGVVSKIEPSHFDPATAYVAVDMHLNDNRDPYLYKTTDFGKTWTKISGNLPTGGAMTYTRSIAENPNRKGMLFAGTGNAIFYSMDDGGSWKQMNAGLPAAAVTWIVVQKKAHDLVVSTYGRGLWIMENITPLEQGLMENPTEATRLVAPRPAWRTVKDARAKIDFTLTAPAKNPIQLEILDAKGAVIRKQMLGTGKPGLNRTNWDLRYEAPRLVALRTTPSDNPHIWEEPRFDKAETRPVLHWGIQPAQVGPIAGPGKYTIRLTVDGTAYAQALEVLRPPDSHGNDNDLNAAVSLQLKVRDDISAVSDMTNQIEWMRRQLEDESKGPGAAAELARKIAAIDKTMQEVEYQLISRADSMSDDKFFTTANKLYLNFIWLNGEIGTGGGDVAGTADYGPTETAVGLVLGLERQLAEVKAAYKRVMEQDVPAYNKSIEGTPLKPLKTTGAPPPPPAPAGNRFG